MKILLIPDVHGRDFWVEPTQKYINTVDKVIFLGDYHDPYPQQVSVSTSFKHLRDMVVPFVESNKDKVICLLGNHDHSYVANGIPCRFDYLNCREVKEYLNALNLQLTYAVDGCLFSHSGVLPTWMSKFEYTSIDELNNIPFDDISLQSMSKYRGGDYNEIGSPIWGDLREYTYAYHLKDWFQIFGHTQLNSEYISKDFACLDCRQVFLLDTQTKELKNVSN